LAPDAPVSANPAATSIAKKIVRIVFLPNFILPPAKNYPISAAPKKGRTRKMTAI
jgi:hypothetical protein